MRASGAACTRLARSGRASPQRAGRRAAVSSRRAALAGREVVQVEERPLGRGVAGHGGAHPRPRPAVRQRRQVGPGQVGRGDQARARGRGPDMGEVGLAGAGAARRAPACPAASCARRRSAATACGVGGRDEETPRARAPGAQRRSSGKLPCLAAAASGDAGSLSSRRGRAGSAGTARRRSARARRGPPRPAPPPAGPTKPKSAPKADSAKISQTGCRPTLSPTSLGVRMLPSTNWPDWKIAQTATIQHQSPQNWNSASPIASTPPTIAPT